MMRRRGLWTSYRLLQQLLDDLVDRWSWVGLVFESSQPVVNLGRRFVEAARQIAGPEGVCNLAHFSREPPAFGSRASRRVYAPIAKTRLRERPFFH